MPEKRELAWRPRADLDRQSIAIYLAVERQSPQAALEAIAGIDAAIERVRLLPDSGGRLRLRDMEHDEYRTVCSNPYTIYYRFDDASITIYRILHQRQNIDDFALVEIPFSENS